MGLRLCDLWSHVAFDVLMEPTWRIAPLRVSHVRVEGVAWPPAQSRSLLVARITGRRRVAWISVAAVAALAATALTFTASGAVSTPPPPSSSITTAVAAAEAAKRFEQVADDRLVYYGFESDDELAGWSADDGVSFTQDAAMARTGATSLAVVRDSRTSAGHVEVRASFGALVPPPAFELDGAWMTCHVHPRGTPRGSDLRARMTGLDANEERDQGPSVVLDAHQWTAVSMQIGARDEVGADGRIAKQSRRFGGTRTVALVIRVEAASETLGGTLNIDDCVIEAPDRAATSRSTADDAVGVPVARAPDPVTPSAATPDAGAPEPSQSGAPDRPDRARVDDPPTDDPPSGAPGAPDDDDDGDAGPGGVASYGFESRDALRGWTVLGTATLTADRSVARHGRASLGVTLPSGADDEHVEVRATLAALAPPPDFPLHGALLTCHVRPAASEDAPLDVHAVAVARGRGGGTTAGAPVALPPGRWASLTVELARGRTEAIAVHVAAATGRLPEAVHIDDCSLRQSSGAT